MARIFARYLVSTHQSDDWAAMTTTEHDCYMALLSSEDITWAGVVPYLPERFAKCASDLSERKVERAWGRLEKLDLLRIDHETGEVLVRSFLRHDAVLSKPNITKAFLRAFPAVHSPVLRATIAAEVRRLYSEHSDEWTASWLVIRQSAPELLADDMPEVA